VAARIPAQAVDGVDGDQFARVHHADAVTDRLDLREDMAGEEHRRPLVGPLADHLPHLPDAVGVQPRRGLVQNE